MYNNFHKWAKSDIYLRNALYEVYRHKCVYCGQHIFQKNMEIDHILASNAKAPLNDADFDVYMAELSDNGFDREHPDYIENYFPVCQGDNCVKNRHSFQTSNLRFFHDFAIRHTPDILEKIDQLKRKDDRSFYTNMPEKKFPYRVVLLDDDKNLLETIETKINSLVLSDDRYEVEIQAMSQSSDVIEFLQSGNVLSIDVFVLDACMGANDAGLQNERRLEYFGTDFMNELHKQDPRVEIKSRFYVYSWLPEDLIRNDFNEMPYRYCAKSEISAHLMAKKVKRYLDELFDEEKEKAERQRMNASIRFSR